MNGKKKLGWEQREYYDPTDVWVFPHHKFIWRWGEDEESQKEADRRNWEDVRRRVENKEIGRIVDGLVYFILKQLRGELKIVEIKEARE